MMNHEFVIYTLVFFTLSFAVLSIFLFKKWLKEKILKEQFFVENMQLKIAVETKEAEKIALERLNEAQKNLKTEFKVIAEETLESTQAKWLTQAEKQFKEIHQGVQHDLEKKELSFSHLVNPVKETLAKLDERLGLLQKEKHGQDQVFQSQLERLAIQEAELAKETKALVSALKNSSIRGFWGEVTLKRIVELAGLVNYCDFFEQQTIQEEDRYRPDLLVRLPNERQIIIDAKVPLSAYLQSQEESHQEQKREYLEKHAKQIRSHIQLLSKKSYFEKFSMSPEFVIMFLPVDQIYQAALEVDPSLIEFSAQNSVIIATPMSLIGLLKSIHFAWKQEAISINAKAISEQGEELFKAALVAFSHLEKLGKSIGQSAQYFNDMVGSMESRFIPKANKLSALLGKEEEVKSIAPIEKILREVVFQEEKI
jgi:DNA recombination protein RmuC